jgi:DNA-binding PadR family transcriptional regulator
VSSDVAVVCYDADKGDIVPSNVFIGELEQLVLLTLLHLGDDGYVLVLRDRLSTAAGRNLSRGALYKTLERLESKGLVEWDLEENVPGRGGHPRRRFRVTRTGIASLRASRNALLGMWKGLEGVLK